MTIRYFDFNEIKLWVFLLIIQINTSVITSKLVPIQKSDPAEWREHGVEANLAQFNSLYTIIINEEKLRSDKFCSGKCDSIDSQGAKSVQNLSYPNQCVGSLRHCWLERETEERKKAKSDYVESLFVDCSGYIDGSGCVQTYSADEQDRYQNIRDHTGNICKCLCERDDISNANNERGELLDSICFDSVSVDNGYVATGARFKRYGNVIHLELQQGILSQGKIDPKTLKWTTSSNCNLKQKVIGNFRNDGNYDGLEITLDDLTLTENAVVTGITLGDSLRGRYVDDDGNINENESEILKKSQCHGRAFDKVHRDPDLLPSTALIGHTNYERSEPCNYKIVFGGTKESSDNIQHVVPFVDLQEIVTDQNSPTPIHGIGWYYRGYPSYGGFLALKIFTKE
ncbi:uncharacterized protein LOC130673681 [Microplitis mediator]|uniref:uncharacterized protein LOC130673681 n=1 Tax=Microplitis mediator TaxID=375433 RepID=UPI002555E9B2|nr:uncharacterized protein LOC130673681 [Microplitis mediator]